MNDSKFNMWRSTIYFIKLDGHIAPEEKTWVENYLDKAQFTPEQQKIIEQDLTGPLIDFDQVFEKITAPADRSMLSHFANMIFKSDHDFSQEEQAVLKKIKEDSMKLVDNQEIALIINQRSKDKEKTRFEKAYQLLSKFTLFDD